MDNNKQVGCGCALIAVIVAILVGIGFRAHTFLEFLAMAGIGLLGAVMIGIGLAILASDNGCLSKIWWGIIVGGVALTCVWTVGSFLISGNYEASVCTFTNSCKPADQAAQAQTTQTPGAIATQTPEPTATPAPLPTPTSIPVIVNASDYAWIKGSNLPSDQIASELNRIWSLPVDQASAEAARLDSVLSSGSAEGQQAASFMAGVAFERAGQLGSAHDHYQVVLKSTEVNPYTQSATIRDQIVTKTDITVKDNDDIYAKLFDQVEQQGWFLVSDSWVWDTSRHAAAQVLTTLRADQLSARFFQFLHDQSPFLPPYAYLFIILALTIGARLVTLPLLIRTAKTTLKIRRLKPDIDYIQTVYRGDVMGAQQKLSELYKENGVNATGGCLASVVDLIFVIWALVALTAFAPRLVLDGATFWEAPDVTRFSLLVAIAWAVVALVTSIISFAQQNFAGQNAVAIIISSTVFNGLIVVAASIFKWPAYIFIFYALLSITAMIIGVILLLIVGATERD